MIVNSVTDICVALKFSSATSMCKLLFSDETITPTRSNHMLNILSIVDGICDTNFRKKIEQNIRQAGTKQHEEALFLQPIVHDCPICSVPFSTKLASKVLKVCCGKMICKGCMWEIIDKANTEERLECPFCRQTPYRNNKEYLN